MRYPMFAGLVALGALAPVVANGQYYHEQPYVYQYYAPAQQYYIPEAPHLSGHAPMPPIRRNVTPNSSPIVERSQVQVRTTTPGPGYNREQVRQVQQQLNALGYDAGLEDGVMGSKTLSAMATFKNEQKIIERELFGRESIAALSRATGAVRTQSNTSARILPETKEPIIITAKEVTSSELPQQDRTLSVKVEKPIAGGGAAESAAGGEAPLSANPFFEAEMGEKIQPISSTASRNGISISFRD